jgi:hypothetical protein
MGTRAMRIIPVYAKANSGVISRAAAAATGAVVFVGSMTLSQGCKEGTSASKSDSPTEKTPRKVAQTPSAKSRRSNGGLILLIQNHRHT